MIIFFYILNHFRFDEGERAAEWLTQVLEKPSRLIRCDSSAANKAQFLLVNESSIRMLQRFLHVDDEDDKSSPPMKQTIEIERRLVAQFRPNLVVQPLENEESEENCELVEESWSRIRILNRPNLEFKVVENCTRCQMINIDQTSNGDDQRQTKITSSSSSSSSSSFQGLLKLLYKFKANSKFGIYLQRKKLNDNKSKTAANYFKDQELEIGDIGVATLADTIEECTEFDK